MAALVDIYSELIKRKKAGQKSVAILIDPDKTSVKSLAESLQLYSELGIDFLLVGGSLLINPKAFDEVVSYISQQCSIPLVLFPGNSMQVHPAADAILLLSLISGRNPDLLIGQHVAAAPYLKQSGLEIISTGYILISSGKATTASYISNSLPIPDNKPEITQATAMAGEMLGLKVIYLDGGSGAERPVPENHITAVSTSCESPVIVGGGLRNRENCKRAFAAGADLLVIGTMAEDDPCRLAEIVSARDPFNAGITSEKIESPLPG